MICQINHTVYQPIDEEWRCPKCGKGNSFYIDEPAENIAEDCTKLHESDGLYCLCGFFSSGKAFATRVAKINNLVVCPHCKGKGVVDA